MENNIHVMLEDSVIEFLEHFGSVMYLSTGYKAYIVNGTAYVSTDKENKFTIKQLTTL